LQLAGPEKEIAGKPGVTITPSEGMQPKARVLKNFSIKNRRSAVTGEGHLSQG